MSLPKRFPARDEIATARAEAEKLEPGGEAHDKRRLAGRVMARREMGKLVFLDLVDRSGRIQLLCDTSRTGPIHIDLGDIVGVTGSPARAKRGEPSLAVDEAEEGIHLTETSAAIGAMTVASPVGVRKQRRPGRPA